MAASRNSSSFLRAMRFRCPTSIPFEHGAILMCSSATALHALRKARVARGETVAVFGIGGLGISAIQLARRSRRRHGLRRRRQCRTSSALAERFGAVPDQCARRRSRAGHPPADERSRRRRRARADRLAAHDGAGRRGARGLRPGGARRPHAISACPSRHIATSSTRRPRSSAFPITSPRRSPS